MNRNIHFTDQGLLHFNSVDIFNIIIDVEQYPQFLPWVQQIKIASRNTNQIIADVDIRFKGMAASYRSDINYITPDADKNGDIKITSQHGAFKYLHSQWSLNHKAAKQTLVKFSIDCEFRSRLMHYTMSMMYKRAQEKVMQAFKDRIYTLLR